MASTSPVNLSFLNIDEDSYDPESPRLVIYEEIDVETVESENSTETTMAIDESAKQDERYGYLPEIYWTTIWNRLRKKKNLPCKLENQKKSTKGSKRSLSEMKKYSKEEERHKDE